MKINHARGTVTLDGNEIAKAIDAYLVAHGIDVSGPRTIRIGVNYADDTSQDFLAKYTDATVFVDPSGTLVDNRDA